MYRAVHPPKKTQKSFLTADLKDLYMQEVKAETDLVNLRG